jgi:hypothetical protein
MEAAINKDLEWSMREITDKQRGKQFIVKLSEYIPVYSPSVCQIYNNYACHFTNDEQMHVIPCPYSFTETFSRIPPDSASKSRLQLIEYKGDLVFVYRKAGQQTVLPLKAGLEKIIGTYGKGDTQVPVIMRGDLKEFSVSVPSVHLHLIKLDKITTLSELDKSGIRRLTKDKLVALYKAVRTKQRRKQRES